jgi:CubicO group peptidase (beta-lactamase class C family)
MIRLPSIAALLLPVAVGAQTNGSLAPDVARRIDSVAMAELAATRTPGSALVIVRGDSIVYAKGYGVANAETDEAVNPSMLFRLGSTTKMMTALATLSLAARGVVDLDRPIGTYAPALGTARLKALTLRQLLSHTSGLLDYTSMSGPHDDAAMNAFVPTLTDTAFFTQAGDIFSYSNLGYVVTGYVISTVTGKPYADIMREEVFTPLGMTRSTMRPIEAMTYPLAQGHGNVSGAMSILRPAPDDSRYWPAGSAFTTALDFGRLAMAMMNDGRIGATQALPAAVVRTWLTPVVATPGDSTSQYGFGLTTRRIGGETVIEHGGSRAGYGSTMRVIPSRKVAVIVLGNQSGIGLVRTRDAAMQALISSLAPTTLATTPQPVAPSPDESARLAGSYRNGRTGIDLVLQGSELRARPIPGNGDGALVRRLGDGRYAAGTNRFTVVTGRDGKTMYLMGGSRAMRKQN